MCQAQFAPGTETHEFLFSLAQRAVGAFSFAYGAVRPCWYVLENGQV